MTTKDPKVNESPTIINVTPNEWKVIFEKVDDALAVLIVRLETESIPIDVPYIDEWISLYDGIKDQLSKNPDMTYQIASNSLFGDPSTLLDFYYEVLRVVPSLKPMFNVKRAKKGKRGDINITIHNITEELYEKMKNTHFDYVPSDDNPNDNDNEPDKSDDNPNDNDNEPDNSFSLSSSIQDQVKDIENKLEEATKSIREEMQDTTIDLRTELVNMESSITKSVEHTITTKLAATLSESIQKSVMQHIASSMDESIAKAFEVNTGELTKTIRNGTLMVDKLNGDIRRANETVDNLQQKVNVIQQTATDSTTKASKAYFKAKQSMEETRDEIQYASENMLQKLENLKDEYENSKKVDYDTSTQSSPSTFKSKYYPDEYSINGKLIQIRTKKYNEDTTPISCDSKDTLLMAYDLLQHVSQQYGIFITPLRNLERWDPDSEPTPSTFPYEPHHFDSEESFIDAYGSMSLALATKLKTGVKFSTNYMAANMSINDYATNGYIMLYELIKTAHPKLIKNKATKPTKPKFEGDMNQYFNKYKNWLKYQSNRDRPHVYDDDEIADDVIHAIKTSQWAQDLNKGMQTVQDKLDRWRAIEDSTFPSDLKIEFLSQTLMAYYVENNINPFLSRARQMNHPTVRAMHTRGRSRTPMRRSQSPAYRRRSNSQRSNDSRVSQMQDCDICGGRHHPTTAGCPHLYRQVKVNDYLSQTDAQILDRQIADIDRNRSRYRSTSRDSRTSRHSTRPSHNYR